MVSMLDCIKRVPSILNSILENRNETFKQVMDTDKEINELVFIGSGTSNTSSITAKFIAEKLSGVRVSAVIPSEFLYSFSVFNPSALYVFVSQTGTSTLTRKALALAKEKGFLTAAVSESSETPIAKEAGAFINMGCGKEEYPMRTIGYSASVLTLSLLGMEIGLKNGNLNEESAAVFLKQAEDAANNVSSVIDLTMDWLDKNRRKMLQADCLIFSGSGALYGVALEGAVKVWETPQIISMGYELEEGLHGPNFGYTGRHCVVVLNDGGVESKKAVNLGSFMKYEKDNGFIIGAETVRGDDLNFTPMGGEFRCLEFAAAVQVISYKLAFDQGRDLFAPHDNSAMHKYFHSHDAK